MATIQIGVEVGGTFTDLVVAHDGRIVRTVKVLSTPGSPEAGVIDALAACGEDLRHVDSIVHGSTVATNAVLERKGSRTILATTAGFRDVVIIQRQSKLWLYDLFYHQPEPLVTRDLICEIPERGRADGSIERPLDEAAALAAIEATLRRVDAPSIAIGFLNSYANPAHERRLAELIEQRWPTKFVTTSSDVLPEFREYERFSTMLMSAYLKPVIHRYLQRLDARLADLRFGGLLSIVQSNGGAIPAEAAGRNAARMIMSGPAAGVIGATQVARLAGINDIITFDMGGTSTDICLVIDGEPRVSTETRIGGLPLKMPMIDIHTVGAGGGSIVWLDDGGLLRVGPQSAGADPGPACYGRQNAGVGDRVSGVGDRELAASANPATTNPASPHNITHVGDTADAPSPDTRYPTPDPRVPDLTVTDANLLLGLIRPENFFGGQMRLDVGAAERALGRVADQLGLEPLATAAGARQVVNSTMARGIRLVSTERGYDPRDCTLVAFGGSGPLHAVALAEELEMRRVMFPRHPGLLSAYGLLMADVKQDYVQTHLVLARETDAEALRARFAPLRERAIADFRAYGYAESEVTLDFTLDMRFLGQAYELSVPVNDLLRDGYVIEPDGRSPLGARFETIHAQRYGHCPPRQTPQIVNFRLVAVAPSRFRADAPLAGVADGAPKPAGAVVESTGANGYQYVQRESLPPGYVVRGPAVIEEGTATGFIPAGWRGEVDAMGNILVEREV